MLDSSIIENRRACGGFTMVELILVMVIAGILAAVAVPRLVGRNSFDTRGFTDQLAATVRFAQKLAIAQRRDVLVQLSASTATLCYVATVPCPAASRAPGPGGEKPYTVTAPNGVAIAGAVVVFDAAGRPTNLVAPLDIQVNGAGTYHVWVEQETGYIHD
ncbi:MAG: pilus assembly FimT family protein [Thiobacillus sp.]